MRLQTLAIALAALSGSASAQQIIVLNATRVAPPAAPASGCANAPAGASADIECVLNLAPPPRDAESGRSQRILIRAQWAQASCPASAAQVVDVGARRTRTPTLPVVDQAGSRRSCRS